MNRIKALYRSWAIPCSGTTVYAPRHRAEWLAKIVEPGVRLPFNPYLLHGPFAMAEDRIQHHLLGRDQFIHVRLGVMIEHGCALRMPQACAEPS